ncbi:MAG: hypothetical protein H0U77_13815 [Nocardioidaceae bacterium]|nr:hypothetical protein [Nocardioidaceae bacterium]
MTQRVVLHPAADLIDGVEAEPDDMERIEHPHGAGQGGPQRAGIAAERVQRGHVDAVPPDLVAARHPTRQHRCAPALDDVEESGPAVERHDPGREHGARVWCCGQERGLAHTQGAHPAQPGGVVDQRSPYSPTAAMTVAQPAPRSVPTAATVCPSWPTRRHASPRVRSVNDARGRMSSLVSVHVCLRHHDS